MKIEGTNATEQSRTYGRHFDHQDQLVSKISRESINALKSHFADEMTKDDWRLVGGGLGGVGVEGGGDAWGGGEGGSAGEWGGGQTDVAMLWRRIMVVMMSYHVTLSP